MHTTDTHNPLLSVIVPVCNVEQYLDECLKSIEKQDVDDIEIICINDGSIDNSLNILKKHAEDDPRIIIIDKENAGYGAAVNDGLKKSKGEYVAILESDDFATRHGWKFLLDVIQDQELDMAKGCYWRHSDTDEFFEVYKQVDVHCPKWIGDIPPNTVFDPKDFLRVFWMTPSIWSCVFRKSFLDEYSIRFNESPGASFQDTGFFFSTWATAKKTMIVDEPVLYYRIDNMGSSSKSSKKIYAVNDEIAFAERFVREHDLDIKYRQVLCAIKYKTYLWNKNRISDEYVPEFSERVNSEFFQDIENGDFSPLFFNKNDSRNFLSSARKSGMFSDFDDCVYSSSPLLSIVVTPAGSTLFLRKCLESILEQSYKNIEIICMVDENEQEINQIIFDFCEKDPRLNKLVYSKMDDSIFRDAALLSHGQYVCFIEPDREYMKYGFKRLLATAYTNGLDAAFYNSSSSNIAKSTIIEIGTDSQRSSRRLLESPNYHVLMNKNVLEKEIASNANLFKFENMNLNINPIISNSILSSAIVCGKTPICKKIENEEQVRSNKKDGILGKISKIFNSK